METQRETAPEGAMWTPPYVSMTTFTNFLDRLGAEPMPDRIDKGYLSNYNGSTLAALQSSLRALDLIDDEGNISSELRRMAGGEEARKEVSRTLLTKFYADAVELSKRTGTSAQLEEVFRKLGSGGSTISKQIRFLLQLMEMAGVEKSPHFKAPRARSSTPRKKKKQNGASTLPKPPADTPPPAPNGSNRTVELGTAKLTLALSVDVLSLPRKHRAFVMDLIDTIDDYVDQLDTENGGGDALEDDDLVGS